MANICWYQIRAKGTKKNLMFLYHSMPVYNDINMISANEDTIIFTGDCKWSLDAYCENSNNTTKFEVNKYIDDSCDQVAEIPNEYVYYTLKDKSKILNCEIEVFSEYEDYDIGCDVGDRPLFQHFKNGEEIISEELSFDDAQKKAESLFGINKIIKNYYSFDEENFDEDNYDYSSDDEYPFTIELSNSQLNGGIERAEKIQAGDKVKLIHESSDEYDCSIRVEHELGFIGYLPMYEYEVAEMLEKSNGEEPHAKISNVVPLSKRSKRCKKPLIEVEVYIENSNLVNTSNSYSCNDLDDLFEIINDGEEVLLLDCNNENIDCMDIPAGVTYINEAFCYKYPNLKKITIPISTTVIDFGCFTNLDNLEEVIIEGNPEILEESFSNCPKLKITCNKTASNVIDYAKSNNIQFVLKNED